MKRVLCVEVVVKFISRVLINMPIQVKLRSRTTALGELGQIVGYLALRMPLKTISATTNVPISTCSNIIRLSKLRHANPHAAQDHCANKNIQPTPNCKKGDKQILSSAQNQHLLALVLSNTTYC